MEKKTKLTISGIAKKSIKNIEIAKAQGKNSVVIEKQSNKFLILVQKVLRAVRVLFFIFFQSERKLIAHRES